MITAHSPTAENDKPHGIVGMQIEASNRIFFSINERLDEGIKANLSFIEIMQRAIDDLNYFEI